MIKDAYWDVPATTYVDMGPPLATNLSDDPQRSGEAWRAALATLRTEADEPPEISQEIAERARRGLAASLQAAELALRQQ